MKRMNWILGEGPPRFFFFTHLFQRNFSCRIVYEAAQSERESVCVRDYSLFGCGCSSTGDSSMCLYSCLLNLTTNLFICTFTCRSARAHSSSIQCICVVLLWSDNTCTELSLIVAVDRENSASAITLIRCVVALRYKPIYAYLYSGIYIIFVCYTHMRDIANMRTFCSA